MIFKQLFKAIQARLMPNGNTDLIKFYGYNWGQIDVMEDEDHLILPCALFAFNPSVFTSGGRGSQQANLSFTLQLCFETYAEANSRSDATLMDRALEFFDLFEGIYTLMHNWTPDVATVSTISCTGIVGDPVAYKDKVSLTLGFVTNGKILTNVKSYDEIVQSLKQTLGYT